MPSMSFETNWLNVIAGIHEWAEEVPRRAVGAMEKGGRLVLATAIPITPMKTGALRRSGRVETTRGMDGVTVEVVFGGDGVNYAVTVHENVAENYTTPGTGSKYLERAFHEKQDEVIQMVADKMGGVGFRKT